MRNLLIAVTGFVLIILLIAGCNQQVPPAKTSPPAALTVTYDGNEVHRRNTGWISVERLQAIANTDSRKIIVFGAPWCKACSLLRKALIQAEFAEQINWINIDEPWAARLAHSMGVGTIPLMLDIDKKGDTIATRLGPGKIVVYLLANEKSLKRK